MQITRHPYLIGTSIPRAGSTSTMADHSPPVKSPALCDTEQTVIGLLDSLEQEHGPSKLIFLDFEGINLNRHGKICLGQITWPGSPNVYLLDFIQLPGLMDIKNARGTSLKSLCEEEHFVKVIFDPRMDADALWAQCKVYLR
jgi:hypothetical protein